MNHALAEWGKKHGKHVVEAVAVLTVAIFLIALVWGPSPAQAPATTSEVAADAAVPEAVIAPAADGTVPEVVSPAPTAAKTVSKPLTYEQAIAQYGKYRIQFVNCNGQPGSMNVPKGVKVMLDNRDKIAHTVKVGSKTFKLPALGFAIATMSTMGDQAVLCDGGGASSIKVQ